MKMMRQGDVLLIKVDSIPKAAKRVKSKGRIILAYGEVTGHAHAIPASAAALLEYGDEKLGTIERYLDVKRATVLRHEEHGSIQIEPGQYQVIRQREYSPEEIRTVAD